MLLVSQTENIVRFIQRNGEDHLILIRMTKLLASQQSAIFLIENYVYLVTYINLALFAIRLVISFDFSRDSIILNVNLYSGKFDKTIKS